jgi:hypothetical protein
MAPCKYDDIQGFELLGGAPMARAQRDSLWGYLDLAGKERIPCRYTVFGSFVQVDAVTVAKVQRKGKWGYVGTDGSEVIPAKYDSITDFENGLATVTKKGKTYQINIRDKKVR